MRGCCRVVLVTGFLDPRRCFLFFPRFALHYRNQRRESKLQDSTMENWSPLIPNCLDVDPFSLLEPNKDRGPFSAQMAKDVEYAKAVQKTWTEDVAARMRSQDGGHVNEVKPIIYQDRDGTPLHGYAIRRQNSSLAKKIPGIILFHTGAGPHDMFLLWKADSLVTSFDEGCVVFVADLLSDDSGWAWSPDRSRYNGARDYVLGRDQESGIRSVLQMRIRAAKDAVMSCIEVNHNRLAAMGWCFGGHPVLEIGRMRIPNIRAMATFHGVFDGIPAPRQSDVIGKEKGKGSKVLICNGKQDPFVSQSDLETASATFRGHGHDVEVTSFQDAQHGFTNPAQDFNPNPAFAYHSKSATDSWRSALAMLQSTLRD